MPNKSGESLTKVTLNLFTSDLASLKARYGHGYSEQIRDLVRENVRKHKALQRDMDKLGVTFLTEDMVDGED